VLASGRFSLYLVAVGRLIDSRWRWFGLLFLLLAFGMVVWGQTWLQPHLRGLGFVVYWLVCLGFTLLALITALVDARAIRRQLRQNQADLLREALDGKFPPKADSEPATGHHERQQRQGSNSHLE
jgi:hypothetical protein